MTRWLNLGSPYANWNPDPQPPRLNGVTVLRPRPSNRPHDLAEITKLRERAAFYAQGLDLPLARLEWIP